MNIAVIDIGSPSKNNIGWAIVGSQERSGRNLDACVSAVAGALRAAPLALGFEAPMFVPMRRRPKELTSARNGERDRAFSARAGPAVLVTATVVVPYVLRQLRTAVPDAVATLDWHRWSPDETAPRQLLLFEAFVSNKQRSGEGSHVGDAERAARALYAKLAMGKAVESSVTADERFNILGAMMLRTGWSEDLSVLSEACLVVRGRGIATRVEGRYHEWRKKHAATVHGRARNRH